VETAYGLEIPQSLVEACNQRRTALLVYDMQVGIIRQMENGPELIASVRRVLLAARAAGLRVFFMRHMSLPNESAGVFQLRMAKAWQRAARVADVKPWFLRDSPDFSCRTFSRPAKSSSIRSLCQRVLPSTLPFATAA
jgi:biuret amidohydrolase